MAKEKEVKVEGLNVDNVEESIKNGAVITEDIAKAAAEKIKKDSEVLVVIG